MADKVNYTIQRYGSASDFGQTFSLQKMQTYVHYPHKCINGTAPSLFTISEAYGLTATIQWLMTLLVGISEFTGAKEKITPYQLEKLAHKIFDRCSDLKATEIMLFLDKLESGDFGRISWQNFDPVAVLEKIDSYRAYARRIVEREQQRIADEQAASDRTKAVPCPPEIQARLGKYFRNLASNSNRTNPQVPSWAKQDETTNPTKS